MVASGPSSNYDEADFNHGLLGSFDLCCQELWREVHTPFVQLGHAFSNALSDCDKVGILGRIGERQADE